MDIFFFSKPSWEQRGLVVGGDSLGTTVAKVLGDSHCVAAGAPVQVGMVNGGVLTQ